MSRVPPDSFFAPVARPWVEPTKPKMKRRRLPSEQNLPAFNPVLTEEVRNGLNGSEPHTATQEKPAAERFKRISVPPTKRTKGGPGPSGMKWEGYVEDAQKRIEREDAGEGSLAWKDANALTFVALYTLMHSRVYGVEASMSSNDRVLAASMIKRLMTSKFSNDAEQFTWFFSWVWDDEAKRWNATKASKRMSWKWCFTNDKFDDWQANIRKKREKRDLVDVGTVRV